jgi:hypothetical protein
MSHEGLLLSDKIPPIFCDMLAAPHFSAGIFRATKMPANLRFV